MPDLWAVPECKRSSHRIVNASCKCSRLNPWLGCLFHGGCRSKACVNGALHARWEAPCMSMRMGMGGIGMDQALTAASAGHSWPIFDLEATAGGD